MCSGQPAFVSTGASLTIFPAAEHSLRAAMPLFLHCHCGNICSRFRAVAPLSVVPNLCQGSWHVVHAGAEERYFPGEGTRLGGGRSDVHPPVPAGCSCLRAGLGVRLSAGLLMGPACWASCWQGGKSYFGNFHEAMKCWGWPYSGAWCMGRAPTWVHLHVLVQEDMAGEWRTSMILPTPLVSLGARHLKNVGKNNVHKAMLVLSCFIDF